MQSVHYLYANTLIFTWIPCTLTIELSIFAQEFEIASDGENDDLGFVVDSTAAVESNLAFILVSCCFHDFQDNHKFLCPTLATFIRSSLHIHQQALCFVTFSLNFAFVSISQHHVLVAV